MNKRMIMVEGCDKTGKSTFISILKEKLENHNKQVIIFRLLGPMKYDSLNFNNDEKSLIQLSKFNEAYNLIDSLLQQNDNLIVILDRCHFGEYVWSKYWNRQGKFINYLYFDEFNKKHQTLFNESIYINYYINNTKLLEKRILESEEDDVYIFTHNNKNILDNINNVLKLYEDVFDKIHKSNIVLESYNNIGSITDVENYANYIIKKYIKENNNG